MLNDEKMSSQNCWLRSLTVSEEGPVETEVDGSMPEWLEGTLFRNGPGRYDYGKRSNQHLFDGHALLHKFKIGQNKVVYSSKFLETKSYRTAIKENRLYPVFGTPDAKSNIYERVKTFLDLPDSFDNFNISISPFGDHQLYALTETNYMGRIDPASLKLIETVRVTDYVRKITTTIAHPHYLDDGSWLTMGISRRGVRGFYELLRYKLSDDPNDNCCKNAQVITRFPGTGLGFSYFHSFALTTNYIIFLEQSLRFSFRRIAESILLNKSISNILRVDRRFDARIHLVNRHTGKRIKSKYCTEPMCVFHHINAYEDESNEEIVMDVCAYDVKDLDITQFTREKILSGELIGTKLLKSMARRIRVPLGVKSKKMIRCQVNDLSSKVSIELPSINYSHYNGRPYKYVFGVNLFQLPFSIVKLNVENESEVIENDFDMRDQRYVPSEPVFVPNPEPKSDEPEDDGVLLVLVLADKNDFLSVMDGKTLKELARAIIPEHVKAAYTFHGYFADLKTCPRFNIS